MQREVYRNLDNSDVVKDEEYKACGAVKGVRYDGTSKNETWNDKYFPEKKNSDKYKKSKKTYRQTIHHNFR